MELERAIWGLVVGATAATLGCATVSAPIGRTVTRGEVTAHVERTSARTVRETRVAVVMQRVPPGVSLLGAFVATDGAPYCAGTHADRFSRSGAADDKAPLSNGERVILEFPPAALDTLTAPSPRLDLLVGSAKGTRRCIPLPLVDGERTLAWEYDQRFTVGVDLSLEGFTHGLAPVTQLATIALTVGMWIDRVRLDVGVGVGGAGCPDDYCKVEDPEASKIDYKTVVPVHAGVEIPLWEAGEFSVGVGARYRAVKLAADTFAAHESFWAHGPVLAPYVAAVMPATPDGLGGSRLGFAGFEVPVGYVMAENGEHAVSAGVNLRMFFTAW